MNDSTDTAMTDDEAANLLRATFASRAGAVDASRAATLMHDREAAGAGARQPRRIGPAIWGAVAASVLVVAMLAAGVVTGGFGLVNQAPAPAGTGPTATGDAPARRMSDDESSALWRELTTGIREAGTLRVAMTYNRPASPPAGQPSGLVEEPPVMVTEVDLRDASTPRARMSRTRGDSAPTPEDTEAIAVGDRTWQRPRPSAAGPPAHPWTRGKPVPPSTLMTIPFLWTVDPADTVWDLGTGTVEGVPARHVVVSAGTDDSDRPLAPAPRPTDGRGLLDLWVARDSGRVLAARMDHDYDTLVARQITYGADVTIQAPSASLVGPDPSAERSTSPSSPPR